MTPTWVIGGGGLLGGALERLFRSEGVAGFRPEAPLPWGDEIALEAAVRRAATAFAARAREAGCWELHWAAGIGNMGSTAGELGTETRALEILLDTLRGAAGFPGLPGRLTFASSAGAIYAGAGDAVITERTAEAPTTAYAHAKLAGEALVHGFVAAQGATAALLARISTLYGPGQATGKRQGLLAHIARSTLRNRPIQIYVPYDTIRDYIDADDAARLMVAAVRTREPGPAPEIKIIASETPVTIAEILQTFSRIARRAPRIARSANRLSDLYAPCVRFRSLAAADRRHAVPVPLPVGVSRLMAAERQALATGAVR